MCLGCFVFQVSLNSGVGGGGGVFAIFFQSLPILQLNCETKSLSVSQMMRLRCYCLSKALLLYEKLRSFHFRDGGVIVSVELLYEKLRSFHFRDGGVIVSVELYFCMKTPVHFISFHATFHAVMEYRYL